MTEGDQQSVGGAGNWSLRGFDYQVDVSVWLALDLMVAARLTAEMTLEHVSEEDVEADVEELEPETVANAVPMRSGYRLIVQAKRRTGDAWTEAKYTSLLTHGKRRLSAKARLEADPNARYLLVTSAALNGPVRRLSVRRAGAWPAATKASANIAATGTDIAGRLAIIGNQDDERLVSDIKELMLERFRVPRARWEDALKVLREAAWARMRGKHGGVWTRDEVEALIAEHEGYLVAGAEHDDYVHPTNWGDLTAALVKHKALIIIGQSGSGKTATAEALWQECKTAIPDLKRVHITHGPDQLRTDTTLPPVFYDIEDPWGRFKFEPESRPWNDQLAPVFQSARHDRLFVATSRLDVAQSSGAIDSIQRWRMPLDVENYGRNERRALFRNLLRALPPELQAFAHERETPVLQQLSLPLELRKFFDALPGLDREELGNNPAAALAKAIEQAHRDSIEQTVVEQIRARDAIKPAAILWALIKPHGRVSADVLRSIEDPLVDADPSLEDRLGPFVNSFIIARNLRQGADGSLAYYHGKVEAGIEATLAAHLQPVRRVLRTLVDVLLARDDETNGSWGVETAAEIMQVSRRIQNATPQLSRPNQDRIDNLVARRLDSDGQELDRAIKLAAEVGSERSNLAEFARWLEFRPVRDFPGIMHWGTPERNDVWQQRMRGDPAVKLAAERFVRSVLPTDQTTFTKSFSADLAVFTGDITDAFVDAARSSAYYGYIVNDDVIAVGALANLDRFEQVVDAAVEALTPSEADRAEAARTRLLIYNDEVSEDYAEHLASNDDGATAQTYLDAFVEKVRVERGFRAITEHRHFVALRRIWLDLLIKKPNISPQTNEIKTAVAMTYDSADEENLWALLTVYWDQHHAGSLIERMVEGSENSNIRGAAFDCLIDHLSDRMCDVVVRMEAANNNRRLAEFAVDLVHRVVERGHDAKRRGEAAAALVGTLPPVWRELARAQIAILKQETPSLSQQAAAALSALANPSEDVRASRLSIAQHLDLDAEDDVRWVLAHSNNHDNALAAIDVAIRRGMTAELEAALDHRFAHVVARALTALADPLVAPLPARLLACVERRSSPVRKALLGQLVGKPHANHMPALITLTYDDWQKYSPQGTDDEDFPIAQGAVDAIRNLDIVSSGILDDFISRARTTEDIALMFLMLSCVVRHGTPKQQAQVVSMSCKGKRIVVGRVAAKALFCEEEYLSDDIIALITDEMALGLPAMIAAYHIATLGLRAKAERIEPLAAALAQSDDRCVFVAILAFARHDKDPDQGTIVASRLPAGHPARQWALGEEVKITREMLIDLGDASAVKEAMNWMEPIG